MAIFPLKNSYRVRFKKTAYDGTGTSVLAAGGDAKKSHVPQLSPEFLPLRKVILLVDSNVREFMVVSTLIV